MEAAVELIVVDDGSPEPLHTEYLAGAILLRNEHCQGAPLARKRGFERSTGRYIHFHDSDDDISDGWLEGVMAHVATGRFDMLFTARVVRNAGGAAGDFHEPVALKYLLKRPLALKNYLSYENCIGPLGTVTFSRASVSRMSFPAIASCQDWHMYWEALHEDSILAYDPLIWHVYNRSGDNRISSSAERKRSGMDAVSQLMCQSGSKRFLVSRFLKLGYDLRTRRGAGPVPRALYGSMRAAMMLLARHPSIDTALFGSPDPK